MFERFTERARQIIVLAQQHARDFESEEIDVEHLLLACYTEEKGVAAKVLQQLKVSEARLRDLIEFGDAGKNHRQQIPFTEKAKMVLGSAMREALSQGHNYIGGEHILLAIGCEQAETLSFVGIDATELRAEVNRFLSGKMSPVGLESVTISFEIKVGQVWISPEDVSWYVKFIDGDSIHMERTLTHTVTARGLVCHWRQANDTD